MGTNSPPLTKLAAWQALATHYAKVRELHLRKLFADDAKHGERMAVEALGICFDYPRGGPPAIGFGRKAERRGS
jgi:glucose-6-phosphate isomerase